MRLGTLWAALALAAVVLGSGCRSITTYENYDISNKNLGKVAVLPFVNETGSPEAGRVVAKLFAAELQAHSDLDVMPLDQTWDKLGKDDVRAGDPKLYQELGKKLGADTLIVGVVSEYRYRRSLGEAPVLGMAVCVVHAPTGVELWGATAADEGGCALTWRGSLSELTQKLCRAVVKKLRHDL